MNGKTRALLRRLCLILGAVIVLFLLSELLIRPRVIRHSLASGYYGLHRYGMAERVWEPLCRDDKDPIPENSLGKVRYRQGSMAEAESLFASAVRDKERMPAAHYDLGNALYRENKLDEALQSYKEAMLLDPDDQDAKANYELVLNRQGYKPPPPPQAGKDEEQEQEQEQEQSPQQPQPRDSGEDRKQQYRNTLDALDQKEALDRMARRRESEREKGGRWW